MHSQTSLLIRQRVVYALASTVFIAVICWFALSYTRSNKDSPAPLKSLASAQQADAPLGYPLPGSQQPSPFDHRFIQFSAFERAMIPTATRMSAAMGTRYGGLSYNAQQYWDHNHERGGHHTGDDINGIGGMNTDLGDPVYAAANGIVYYSGEPSPSWGNTIILAHRNTQGDILLSMYSHLDKSYLAHGQLTNKGEVIGTVGTANNNYPAHLHLEMRDSTGIHIGSGYVKNPGELLNPSQTIKENMTKPAEDLFPSILSVAIKDQREQRKQEFFQQ